MPARFFTRINYRFFSGTKILLATIAFFAFFFVTSNAFAQTASQVVSTTDATYAKFNTLFDLPTKKATLTFGKKADGSLGFNTDTTKTTKATDLIYRFDGAFDLTKPGTQASDFWTLIADFTGSRKNFVLRLCDVGDDGKLIDNNQNCWFTEYPSKTDMSGDITAATRDAFVTARADQLNKKIYHYDADWSPDAGGYPTRGSELSIFGVEYQPASFNYYNASGNLVQGSKDLLPGKTYQADLWYCVAGDQVFPAGDSAKLTSITKTVDNIRVFPGLCDSSHLAYVRMAGIRFTVPASQQQLTDITATGQTTDQNTTAATKSPTSDILPECAWFWGSGSFVGCIAVGTYYIVYKPIAWVAALFGKLFDFFLGLSISDEAYRMDFVVRGWQIIRDISNIFFIIILIYTGLMAVFKSEGVSMKRVVPQLILNALLINFSLFATRVVIDISNVVSRIFYNVMDVRDKTTGEEKYLGSTGYKSISEGVVATFDPQRVFDTQYLSPSASSGVDCTDKANHDVCADLNKDTTSFGAQDVQNSVAASRNLSRDTQEYAGYFIVVCLLGALIMFAVVGMFWKTSFFFIGRTVGLYIVMIFAPFAFLTRENMPVVGGIKQLKWSDWVKELTDYAILAPIFIFFLYLIYLLMKSGFGGIGIQNPSTFLEGVIGVATPMLIVYFMLTYAVTIAKNYAGFIGGKIQAMVSNAAGSVVGFAGGAAVGIASGGLGLIGRGVGAAAQATQSNSMFGNWINRNQGKATLAGWAARTSNAALENTKNVSFDPRNSKFASAQIQRVVGETGIKLKTDNALVDRLSLSSKNSAGGFAKYQDRRNKEMKEQVEKVKTNFKTEDDAKNFYKKILEEAYVKEKQTLTNNSTSDALRTSAIKSLEDQKEKARAKGETFTYDEPAIIAEIAKQKTKVDEKLAKIDTFEKFEKEQSKLFGRVKDNKTLTQAMRLRYAKELADDPTSPWNPVRTFLGLGVPVIVPGFGDMELSTDARKAAAEKYLKDTQKSFKGVEKAADELAAIDKTLKDILTKFAEADPATYGEYKNARGEFDPNEMPVEMRDKMLKEERLNLESELEAHDLELDELKQAHRTARSPGDKKRAKESYTAKAKEKAATKDKLDSVKNIINRKDRAQEKSDGAGKSESPKPDGEKPKA